METLLGVERAPHTDSLSGVRFKGGRRGRQRRGGGKARDDADSVRRRCPRSRLGLVTYRWRMASARSIRCRKVLGEGGDRRSAVGGGATRRREHRLSQSGRQVVGKAGKVDLEGRQSPSCTMNTPNPTWGGLIY
jgi:hypothetical protein